MYNIIMLSIMIANIILEIWCICTQDINVVIVYLLSLIIGASFSFAYFFAIKILNDERKIYMEMVNKNENS